MLSAIQKTLDQLPRPAPRQWKALMTTKFPRGEPWTKNFSAVSYIDLEDRPAFKMAIHRSGDRWFLYAAHFWVSGYSIVEITDPSQPRFVRFVPGPPNTWALQVQVADGLMITSQERVADGWGGGPNGPFGGGF